MKEIKKFYDDSFDYIETANVEEAINIIKDLYIKNDICLDELFKNIILPNISISDTVMIYETLIKEIDGDNLLKIQDEGCSYPTGFIALDKKYNTFIAPTDNTIN